MSAICRIIKGTRRCMDKLDIKQCLNDLAIENTDGLNDIGVMCGMYAVVFRYDILSDNIKRVFMEKNIKVAYDWAIHVNEKKNHPVYQVMIVIDARHSFMMTTYKVHKLAGHMNRQQRRYYGKDCCNGKLHWCLSKRQNMEIEQFNRCHWDIMGNCPREYCPCNLCHKYYGYWLGDKLDLSERNQEIALDICACDWCRIPNKTKYIDSYVRTFW